MKTKCIQTWGGISLLSVLAIELLLDNILVVTRMQECLSPDRPLCIKLALFFLFFILLILSVVINWKHIGSKREQEKHKTPQNENEYFRKIKDLLKTLIKNSVSGNWLDLLFVIFFLLHLTWIPDSIFDSLKDDLQTGNIWLQLLHPFIYITGLFLVIILKPQVKKTGGKAPRVVLSGISLITDYSIKPLLQPLKEEEIEKMEVFVDRRIKVTKLKGLENKECFVELNALHFLSDIESVTGTLRDILPHLKEIEHEVPDIRSSLAVIEEEIIVADNISSIENALRTLSGLLQNIENKLSESSNLFLSVFDKKFEKGIPGSFVFFCNQLQDSCNPLQMLKNKLSDQGYHNIDFFPYSKSDTLRSWIVKRFVKELVKECNSNARVEVIECDYDDIPQTYRKISDVVKELLKMEYEDNNLLFNITPGTANFSVALALNSIKGDRICAYQEQNGNIEEGITVKKFRKENLDVYDLKEVFSELLD